MKQNRNPLDVQYDRESSVQYIFCMNTMFITQDTDTLQSIIVVVTHFIKS